MVVVVYAHMWIRSFSNRRNVSDQSAVEGCRKGSVGVARGWQVSGCVGALTGVGGADVVRGLGTINTVLTLF